MAPLRLRRRRSAGGGAHGRGGRGEGPRLRAAARRSPGGLLQTATTSRAAGRRAQEPRASAAWEGGAGFPLAVPAARGERDRAPRRPDPPPANPARAHRRGQVPAAEPAPLPRCRGGPAAMARAAPTAQWHAPTAPRAAHGRRATVVPRLPPPNPASWAWQPRGSFRCAVAVGSPANEREAGRAAGTDTALTGRRLTGRRERRAPPATTLHPIGSAPDHQKSPPQGIPPAAGCPAQTPSAAADEVRSRRRRASIR